MRNPDTTVCHIKIHAKLFISEKDTICSRKHDTSSYHFTQYAPNRPHVNVFTVTHAQNNFRGSVVPRHNIRSHHECCTSRSRKAKVKDLLNVKYTNKCYNQLHYLARVSQISLVAGFHGRPSILVELEFGALVFVEGGKLEALYKTLRAMRTNDKPT